MTDDVVKLVNRAAASVGLADNRDAVQEGYLAGVLAYRTYQPDKGTLSGWIMRRATGAMLDYVNKEATHGMGGKNATVEVDSLDREDGEEDDSGIQDTLVDSLTYAPAGLQEPDLGAELLTVPEILWRLSPSYAAVLRAYYGIGRTPLTVSQMAELSEGGETSVRRHLTAAIEAAREVLRTYRTEE